ncbi:MAG: HemK2/MTQ2 family protein methyltransferase [Euryarchaeota archaeon]|nr:HemK2/MTQ2 family protein methyltransferase [Euryarchaeota archaeon]
MRSMEVEAEVEAGTDLDLVYEPAEDTFLLLRTALEEVRPADSVLEMGCGRGLISRELTSKARRVIATDINPHALRMARKTGIETVRADLFRGIKARFDLILFNPPHLPTGPQDKLEGWLNLAFDGGVSGRETINPFLEGLRDHLAPEGRALLLVSSLSGLSEIEEKARSEGLEAMVVAREKYFFEELVVLRLRPADVFL